MKRAFIFLVKLIFVCIAARQAGAEKETIIKVPYKTQSIWRWPWQRQWGNRNDRDGKVFVQACDINPNGEPKWIRSNVFHVDDAKRIDVTVQYAVSKCSSLAWFTQCKEYFNLAVHKTSMNYTTSSFNPVPEPQNQPEAYKIFGTTSPSNLSAGFISRDFVNTETYSFLTNSLTPNYYLAIQYEGGCFNLYSVTISYSVCPLLPLPTGLIQLPRTIAPINGTIKVFGLCTDDAQPLANDVSVFGHCKANGEWSSLATQGECWCKAGYEKHLNGSGAVCKDCPPGTFQDLSSDSACKPCPLNSVQGVGRKRCDCVSRSYRTKDDTVLDHCTEQPSAPQEIRTTFLNASVALIQWKTPSNLGGRSDQYYEVQCMKCDGEGRICTKISNGILIYHSPRNSRRATIKHLSPYTFYQFKVIAKNGVTHLAEENGEKSKYAEIVERTKETWKDNKKGSGDLKTVDATVPALASILSLAMLLLAVFISYYLCKRKGLLHRRSSSRNTARRTSFDTYQQSIALDDLDEATPEEEVRGGDLLRSEEASPEEVRGDNLPKEVEATPEEEVRGGCLPRDEESTPEREARRSNSRNAARKTDHLNDNALDEKLWEVPRKNLSIIKKLGSGNFGIVYKAVATELNGCPGQVTVAVKTLKDNVADGGRKDFLNELQLMMTLKPHRHVVKFLGCCTKSDGPMRIILEFLPYGDLFRYLRRSRGDLRLEGKLTSHDLLNFAWMIADGMSFLAENKCVHRDLATRNVLVGEGKICKISDFGLARRIGEDVYTRSKSAVLPIKWMPPESIFHGKSTSASDVWSYGVVLWEIFTLGDSPYSEYTVDGIRSLLENGDRLEIPHYLSETLHSLMSRCWQENPEDRPSFREICDEINTFIKAIKDYINLDVFKDPLYVNFDVDR